MSELGDPTQWRSAEDPKTGREYWYHRVDRISTWIKPPCLFGATTNIVEIDRRAILTALNDNHEEGKGDNCRKFSAVRNNLESYYSAENDEFLDGQEIDGNPEYMSNGMKDDLSDDLSVTLSNAVSCLTSSDEYSRVDALLFLSSRCGTNAKTSAQLASSENFLDSIVVIIIEGRSKKCRQLALKILCSISICKEASSIFVQNQSWMKISHKYRLWENDNESSILFSIFIGCLYSNSEQVVNIIPKELDENILTFLTSIIDDNNNNNDNYNNGTNNDKNNSNINVYNSHNDNNDNDNNNNNNNNDGDYCYNDNIYNAYNNDNNYSDNSKNNNINDDDSDKNNKKLLRSFEIDLESLQFINFASSSNSGIAPDSKNASIGDWSFLYYLFIKSELGYKVPGLLLLIILGRVIRNVPEEKNNLHNLNTNTKTNINTNTHTGTNTNTNINISIGISERDIKRNKNIKSLEDEVKKDKDSKYGYEFGMKLKEKYRFDLNNNNMINDVLQTGGGATVLLGLCTGCLVDEVCVVWMITANEINCYS